MDTPPLDRESATGNGATGPLQPVDLHRLVKTLAPAAVPGLDLHLAKPTHFVIAVLRHNCDCNEEGWQCDGSFMWIKGRNKVTVAQVKAAYLGRNGDPNLRFELKMGNWAPPDDMRMDQLDSPDRHIIFNSVELPTMETLSAASLNRDLRISRGPSTPSRATPIRQPLQPVSRQVSVHPKQAQERPPAMKAEPAESEVQLPPPIATEVRASAEAHEAETQEAYKPRPQEDPFPAMQEEEEEAQQKRGLQLKALTDETSLDRLESAVFTGVKVLSDLETPLKGVTGSADAIAWLEQIGKARDLAARTRTVVGVVGNTGAGKSSVLNAMLDEERLVPTNCMRACTAVVTELSYNHTATEKSKYRAEIEFIKDSEWRKELEILFKEILDDSGHVSREAQNPDTEAGVAFAKIRAVYHKYTKEMLANASVDELMRIKNVKSVLGTTKHLDESDPAEFYRRLQGYVDSKEKGTEKYDTLGRDITNRVREFEYWPLIKVVKTYTKAEALSTGAVIVDLPGVHDSNAARAAVAEGYMKSCTGLWIVAPINRAVDDKAAKTLLGNTFKRQLKYDGTYSAVTFICSKTDDISRTEAADSLQLEEFQSLDQRLDEIRREKKIFTKEFKQLKDKKDDHAEAVEQIDDDLEKWEDLESKCDDGKTVYAPSTATTSKKCKGGGRQGPAKKKRRVSAVSDDEVEYISSSDEARVDDNSYAANETADLDRQPLTSEEVAAKIADLKQLKREARRERQNIDGEIREVKEKLRPLEEEEESIDMKQSALCIKGRNDYSRDAIRQDFADGIRELDQENAEEEGNSLNHHHQRV